MDAQNSLGGGAAIISVAIGRSLTLEGFHLRNNKNDFVFNAGVDTNGDSGVVTLRRCKVEECSNGFISSNSDFTCVLTVEDCEFVDNGLNNGYYHNFYVGAIPSFTLTGTWVHHTKAEADYQRIQEAEKRADALQTRLQKRLDELRLEAQIFPLPPVVLGGVVIVPQGLLSTVAPHAVATPGIPADTQASAARARAAVMDVERRLGFLPVDREADKLGYDIESKVPGTGKLRFIEVKGRIAGADTITVTRNEILYSLNKPDDFILAIVEFDGDKPPRPRYVRRPFQKDVEFSVTSVNYNMADLLARAEEPA
jgi:hypothetical protein